MRLLVGSRHRGCQRPQEIAFGFAQRHHPAGEPVLPRGHKTHRPARRAAIPRRQSAAASPPDRTSCRLRPDRKSDRFASRCGAAARCWATRCRNDQTDRFAGHWACHSARAARCQSVLLGVRLQKLRTRSDRWLVICASSPVTDGIAHSASVSSASQRSSASSESRVCIIAYTGAERPQRVGQRGF